MDKLLEILTELKPEIDFDKEKALIDDNLIESLDIISIVSELNDTFDIEIDVNDLLPENFNSVEAMMELIEKLQAE